MAGSWRGTRIYTIGHSTRTLDELVELLRSFDVSVLADIRTIPRSRHNPQFNKDTLGPALASRGLRYVHLPRLGGLRHTSGDSPNTAWRNASFRGFADYMVTPEFEAGLADLRALTEGARVAVMCAEAVPWRCHRSLVADALTVRGVEVEHITGIGRSNPHHMTPFARVDGTRVTYPGEEGARAGGASGGRLLGQAWVVRAGGRLAVRSPFHLEATVRVLQRRPANPVDVWEEESYRRVLVTAGGLVLVEVANRGTIEEPDIRFKVLSGNLSAAERRRISLALRRVLGLDVDPLPLQERLEAEPRLEATAVALRGMRPPRFPDLFETFANVVPFQQLSLESGLAIVRRLVERFGEPLQHGGRLWHAFPEARAVAKARVSSIKACGLSAGKAETLRRAAAAVDSGELTEEMLSRMSSADAIRTLTDLPGIGPWSAGLILLRGFGRLDVFPAGDVGAAQGLMSLLRLRAAASIDRIVRRFGDARGYLYFCSLGASLLARGLIRPAEAQAPPRRNRG